VGRGRSPASLPDSIVCSPKDPAAVLTAPQCQVIQQQPTGHLQEHPWQKHHPKHHQQPRHWSCCLPAGQKAARKVSTRRREPPGRCCCSEDQISSAGAFNRRWWPLCLLEASGAKLLHQQQVIWASWATTADQKAAGDISNGTWSGCRISAFGCCLRHANACHARTRFAQTWFAPPPSPALAA